MLQNLVGMKCSLPAHELRCFDHIYPGADPGLSKSFDVLLDLVNLPYFDAILMLLYILSKGKGVALMHVYV